MVTLKKTERKTAVLSPSNLACLLKIPTINLTLGCAHNCVYCYARGYSMYPGDRNIILYSNIPEKLETELSRKKKAPQYVYFSPSSDLFQPVPEVQELCYRVLEILLSRRIGVAFLTKGEIPDKTMKLLAEHSDLVRSQFGLISLDELTRQIIEPDAAPVDVRLTQMKELIGAGIAVEARMVPIIPGVTDTDDALADYFNRISRIGIKKVAVSTLFLRPSIKRNLEKCIKDRSLLDHIFSLYATERMQVKAPHSSIVPLPVSTRKRIYRRIQVISKDYSIDISVCGCMNPDIGGICHIGGTYPGSETTSIQGNLFE
jgi:DNA repair photolyase